MANYDTIISQQKNKGIFEKVSKRLDFFQLLSGILLALFVFGHLFLVSSVLISPKLLDDLAWFLEEIYIAQFIALSIFLLIIAHFIIAARKMPFRQGEISTFIRHAKSMKHNETWAWCLQVITGVFLLFLALTHIYQVMTDLPITALKSVERVQASGGHLFYFALLLSAWFHVGIGIFRMGVKYGFITAKTRKNTLKYIVIIVSICIFIGFMTELRLTVL